MVRYRTSSWSDDRLQPAYLASGHGINTFIFGCRSRWRNQADEEPQYSGAAPGPKNKGDKEQCRTIRDEKCSMGAEGRTTLQLQVFEQRQSFCMRTSLFLGLLICNEANTISVPLNRNK
ncbi:uncharacterized protein MEPE_05845 [Melanopsichium pennsylvanicum]|uniref:Uncharacterized protein n=1 Tax=Melanopsichium pennsylvanicum TaxID=63383 RepID=A0AAJ5C7Q0_9BASI|nr:uncharacterized protein MEPE_05845 [Melanopsichium pennsylvanicum]